jgi:hypothetical protein
MKTNKHATVRGVRARFLGTAGLLVGAVALTFTGVAAAGTSGGATAPMVITLARTMPSMPVPGASLAAWQSYATQENSALESGATSVTYEGQSCPLDSFTAVSEGAGTLQAEGAPNGVALDGFAFTLGNCDVNVTSSSSSNENTNIIRPDSSPGAGATCASVGGAVSYGTQCTYPCTIDGDSAACTSFKNLSADFYGHTELSSDGADAMTCSVGSSGTNGTQQDQIDGDTYIVGFTVNASNVWNGNDWKGTGSPWTDLGDVCAGF